MSKIMKGCDVQLADPIVVQLRNERITEHILEVAFQKQDNNLNLQAEADKIMLETEAIVLELMEKARTEAHYIINEAREEAEAISIQARDEAVQVLEQARVEGFEKGLRNAQSEMESDRQMAIKQSQDIVEEARREKIKILKSSISDMARLSMAIARRVITVEIATNPDIIIGIIKEAINYLDQQGAVRIYLHTQDLDRIINDSETLNSLTSKEIRIDLLPDKGIDRGGCIIESESGSVDACTGTRIDNIEQAIQDVIIDESSE